MNRLLAENATTGKYEIVSSTAGALNTTGGGAGGDSNSIVKALTDIADPATAIFLKTEANGSLNVKDNNITVGNAPTAVGGSLQQVLMYGKKPDNTLQPLETVGDRLLVDVLELAPSGAISTSTALSAIQVCAKGADNKFKTLSSDNNGVLDISNSKITRGEANVTGGGDGLQQVLMYGKDQSGNLDPINVDSNGHLKITLNDIEASITNAIKTEIFGIDGSTQRQIAVDANGKLNVNTVETAVSPVSGNSTLPAVQICGYNATAPEMNVLNIDTVGNLKIADNTPISRGSITFPSPFGSGATSTSIDVGDYRNFHFHTEGSAGSGHAGFILQGSNDNTNFVKIQLLTPQTIASVDSIRGSISDGYRYYRLENGGTSVSVTTSIYNLYS